MSNKYLNSLGLREKIILSLGVLVASAALPVLLFLEPALKNYSENLSDILNAKNEIIRIKAADKEIGVKPLDPGRAIIYLYNYMEGVTVNSGVKLKNFQASGSQGSKGMANFQLKLGSNASTFARLLFIAENTVPAMYISNFRISSQSGGTYEGMRQLETIASVSISTKRLGGKTFYADGTKFKALKRDPFAASDGKPEVKPPETKAAGIENWILTAAMSDEDGDILLFKKEGAALKYAVSLKKGGGLALKWSGESVEIKTGAEKISWVLGETTPEDSIPKVLKEEILKGDTGKSEKAPGAEITAESELPELPQKNTTGLTEEELKKMGIPKDSFMGSSQNRSRPSRRSGSGR